MDHKQPITMILLSISIAFVLVHVLYVFQFITCIYISEWKVFVPEVWGGRFESFSTSVKWSLSSKAHPWYPPDPDCDIYVQVWGDTVGSAERGAIISVGDQRVQSSG